MSTTQLPDEYYPNALVFALQSKLLRHPNHADAPEWKKKLLEIVKTDEMAPFYEKLCPTLGWQQDKAFLETMKKQNEEQLKALDAKKSDAEENLGETEVKDALVEKAIYLARIGDKDRALEAFDTAYGKIVGIGQKLDTLLTRCRLGFFFEETNLIKKNIDLCHEQLDKGGDWERKNKLKVYEGLFAIQTRDFKKAADQLIDATATFTATELMSMKDFILYCVITAMVGMTRAELRTKVVSNPEILSVIEQWPMLKEFMNAFFYCKYDEFMRTFVVVIDHIRQDHFLDRQSRYIVRALRLIAFRQFLASYKSVTIAAMANSFGVSESFIDAEVSAFINSSKLTCKIDKVNGIIESNIGDTRNMKFSQIIKQGDLLLNHMQKVAATLDR